MTQHLVCAREDGRTEDWRHSQQTQLAALLGALGYPIAVEKVWRDTQGDERVTYLHARHSIHAHRQAMPAAKRLIREWRNGKLAEMDVHHPLLDGLRCIANVIALRTWLQTGTRHTLAQCAPARGLLTPAPDAPQRISGDYVRTNVLSRAAALATLGFQVLAIEEPQAGKPAYALANDSAFPGQETASALITQLKAGTLLPTHAFAFAVEAAVSYLQLLKHVQDTIHVLMFSGRKTGRHAFVRSDATKLAHERTDRFVTATD